MKIKHKPLSSVEWDTCWMAIRYAMNRQTIASATLPRVLLREYYDRWSGGQKKTIFSDLRDNYDDYGCFGSKYIDNHEWMRFMLTLDPKAHCIVTASDGENTETVECIEFEGKYYPISGSSRWWDGAGGGMYIAAEYIKSVKSE